MIRRSLYTVCVAVILGLYCSFAWAAAPRNGLVGEWLFEGNANDTSGKGNNGVVNGATLTSDRFWRANGAYYFNGSSNYIQVPNSTSLGITNAITMAAWIYVDSYTSSYAAILSKGQTSEPYELLVYNNGGAILNPYFNGYGGVGSTPIPQNKWVHVAVTWDGTTIKYYVNGALDKKTDTFAGPLNTTSEDLFLGASPYYNPEWMHGKIDDVRIYNRALSAAEIDAVYHDKDPVISSFTVTPNAGSAPLATNLVCRAKSPNGPITQYLWDFNGDGVTDDITDNGTHARTYSPNAVYRPRVKVVDSKGYYAYSDHLLLKLGNGAELAGKIELFEFNETTKTVNIKTRVYNWGNAAAGPFKVNFAISDNGVGSLTFYTSSLTGLAARSNTLLNVSHTFGDTIHDRLITILIDSGKQVTEVDETNNTIKLTVGHVGR